MLDLPEIQIDTTIYQSSNTTIYRGWHRKFQKQIILKTLTSEYPTISLIGKLGHEKEILKKLNGAGIPTFVDLIHHKNSPILITEDIFAKSLAILFETKSIELVRFLEIAIQITDILGRLHKKGVIHKDLNPSNIVLNEATQQIQIIDFGNSTFLPRETIHFHSPDRIDGTLPYIAPEQTGRMNRAIDYRADFYSLGATFYELLAGQPPFISEDPIKLIYHHMANPPVPLQEGLPRNYQSIGAVVMKLLSKAPENRYQSAYGLKYDLEQCLLIEQAMKPIHSFQLGAKDRPERFQIPEKLYGRDDDVKQLLDTFAQVVNGKSQLMMVTGYSGIGKSALVNEVQKPIVQSRGYFTQGKFEQFQKEAPFSALIQAFQELLKQLLTETSEQLINWKQRILEAVSPNTQIIIEVIPELELIVGKQPKASSLPPAEAQNRFNTYFRRFVEVFATKQHPLVIFLDDLQWADNASLDLIKLFITAPDSHYLFLIGAYRNNEVEATHPLILTLDVIRNHHKEKSTEMVKSITLKNLSFQCVNQMIAETLFQLQSDIEPLSQLIMTKTNGNPFFTREFLISLYWERLLYFNESRDRWEWNLKEIQNRNFTDNVIELMAQKIQFLSQKTQDVLKLAACIGGQFDLHVLSIAHNQLPSPTNDKLREALEKGFIFPLENDYQYISNLENLEITPWTKSSDGKYYTEKVIYKFVHDRIQQAAYQMVSEDEKEAIHLKIGKLLLANAQATDEKENITQIVKHMNIGRLQIQKKSENIQLAQMNCHVGIKYKNSTAYAEAINYFDTGIACLLKACSETEIWEKHYGLIIEIYKEKIECHYLLGNYEMAEDLTKNIMDKCQSNLDQAHLYYFRTFYALRPETFKESVRMGQLGLQLLGMDFPLTPTKDLIQKEYHAIEESLKCINIQELAKKPPLTDPTKIMILKFLSRVSGSAYMVDLNIAELSVIKAFQMVLKYGDMYGASCSTYAAFLISCGKYSEAFELSKVAVKLGPAACGTNYLHGIVSPWKRHIVHCISKLEKALKLGIVSGDLYYARYSCIFIIMYRMFHGNSLNDVEASITKFQKFVEESNDQIAIHSLNLNRLWLHSLTTMKFVSHHAFDNQNKIDFHIATNVYSINKLQIAFIFEDYQTTFNLACETEKILGPFTRHHMILVNRLFYLTLSGIFLMPHWTHEEIEEIQIWKIVSENQQKLKDWADLCPENYLHKYLLVSAEKACISGDDTQAMQLYEDAIEQAKTNGYLCDVALANELAAKHYLTKKIGSVAKNYMVEARYWYERWGATSKVKHLEKRYPDLLKQVEVEKTATTHSTSIDSIELDLNTVLQSSQAISEEIQLEAFLEKMIRVIIENTGAQKGTLLFEKDDHWQVEAVIQFAKPNEANEGGIQFTRRGPFNASNHFPKSLIHYVTRTKQPVVLDNASHENRFFDDPYIQRHQSKSILCQPLVHGRTLVGILYLENELTTGVFTSDRLEVIKLLSSQAAISIENSKLYTSLQEHTEELQKTLGQLETEHRKLQHTQTQLIQAEKTASSALSELQQAHAQQNEIIEQERLRIAQELHDDAQQIFGAVLRSYVHRLPQADQQAFLSEMGSGQKAIDSAINELYPPALQNLGLVPALEDYILKLNRFKNMAIEFKYMVLPDLSKSIRVALFRMVQECLSNVIKHAGTREAEVIIQQPNPGLLWIQISDEGRGFDTKAPSHRYGLTFMKERARKIGAQLEIQSEVGEGTTVICKLALPISA